METKKFHIGDVLSITTRRLVSPTKMDGVYKILNFLTRDNLYTHALGRAAEESRPWLFRRFPQLKDCDISEIVALEKYENEPDEVRKPIIDKTLKLWLKKQVAKYGEFLDLTPIPADEHEVKDPLIELREMAPNKPIITIEAPQED